MNVGSSSSLSQPWQPNYHVTRRKGLTSGYNIEIKDNRGLSTTIFGKAMKDLGENDLRRVLMSTELHPYFQGSDPVEEKDITFIPLKLIKSEKNVIVFVEKKDILRVISKVAQENLLQPNQPMPEMIYDFLQNHMAKPEEIRAELESLSEKNASKLFGSSKARYLKTIGESIPLDTADESNLSQALFNLIREEGIVNLCAAAGISEGHAKAIWAYIQKEDFKTLPEYVPGESLYVDKNKFNLPYSLLICEDGSIDILLKGKSEVKIEYKMREHGAYKSVKTVLNLVTGEIEVQITMEIGAKARKKVEKKLSERDRVRVIIDRNNLTQEQALMLEVAEGELIDKAIEEYRKQNLVSDLKLKGFTLFAGRATNVNNIAKRILEDKLIRKEGELVLTMIAPKGLPVQDPAIQAELVAGTTTRNLSPQFRLFLNDTVDILLKLIENHFAHRDLKKENLVAIREDNMLRVNVIDMGLSCLIDVRTGAPIDRVERGAGTFYSTDMEQLFYLFPSALRSVTGLNFRNNLIKSDTYSMGSIWYNILTGSTLPFNQHCLDLIRRVDDYEVARFPSAFLKLMAFKDLQTALIFLYRQGIRNSLSETRTRLQSLRIPAPLISLILNMVGPSFERLNPEEIKDFIKTYL